MSYAQCSLTGEDKCVCSPGFEGNAESTIGCTIINTCNDPNINTCGPNTSCLNYLGITGGISYDCKCKEGYIGNPYNIIDGCFIDKCKDPTNLNICGPRGTCEYFNGILKCNCDEGYQQASIDNITCVDVDECKNTIGSRCSKNAECINKIGSFECKCLNGYTGDPYQNDPRQGGCIDVDECKVSPPDCGSNAECTNTVGNYTCNCINGYEGIPPNCVPDSCALLNIKCGANSECNKATTPFTCKCREGYTGDPLVGCTAIDACSIGVPPCFNDTVCVNNTGGSYSCLIKERIECPTKQKSACANSLDCEKRFSYDSTYVCCKNALPCASNTSELCCTVYSREGQRCRNTLDCLPSFGELQLECKFERRTGATICCYPGRCF